MSRLETVEGSPSKSLRGGEEGGHNGDSTADHEQSQRPEAGASTPAQAAGGKITYSSPALNFSASPRLISDKFDQHVEYVHSESTQRLKVKDDKERRRQSWNDFVIPRNVLEKQKELKEGIRGVRKFASGIEGEHGRYGSGARNDILLIPSVEDPSIDSCSGRSSHIVRRCSHSVHL